MILSACARLSSGTVDSDTGEGRADSGDSSETGSTEDSADTGDSADAEALCDRTQPWIDVTAGQLLTCGVHADGCAECWGADYAGPSDTGNMGHYDWGVVPPPAGPWDRLYLQRRGFGGISRNVEACGRRPDGTVECWGQDTDISILGAGFRIVGIEEDQLCGVLESGTVQCWPWSAATEALMSVTDAAFMADAPAGTVIVTVDGRLRFLVGLDEWQEYTDATSDYQSADVESWFVCATTLDGRASCWDPKPANDEWKSDPVVSTPVGTWHDVCLRQAGVPSTRTACALDESGYPTCWGADIGGDPPEMLSELSCGETHVCGLTLDNRILCWGDCVDGECDTPE